MASVEEASTPTLNPTAVVSPLSLTLAPFERALDDAGHLRDAPPSPPSPMARPPTPGGGPLSSHPATPVPSADRFTPPSLSDTEDAKKADSVTATTSAEHPTQIAKEQGIGRSEGDQRFDQHAKAHNRGSDLEDDNEDDELLGRSRKQPQQETLAQFLSNTEPPPPPQAEEKRPSKHQPQTPTKSAKHMDITQAAATSRNTSRPPSSHMKSPIAATSTPKKTEVPARKPLTPASANAAKNPPISRRNSTGVRKLLSLSSLRSSFSSSRTSLAAPNSSSRIPSTITQPPLSPTSKRRPASPSPSITLSAQSPTAPNGYLSYTASVSGGSPNPNKDRFEGGEAEESAPNSPSHKLRKRKSGGWFRRTSQMWNLDEADKEKLRDTDGKEREGSYVAVSPTGKADGANGTFGRGGKGRDPRTPSLPVLPELQGIGGQKIEGWGEDIFAGIER